LPSPFRHRYLVRTSWPQLNSPLRVILYRAGVLPRSQDFDRPARELAIDE
jgi:hypothetical protein